MCCYNQLTTLRRPKLGTRRTSGEGWTNWRRTWEEATQRVVKKLKEDQTFTFKKKGNEKQYIFNDNVKDQFLATGKHLDTIEPTTNAGRETLKKAKRELEQGLQLISARQKRIRVTDRSEFGWATVDEYEQDALAKNEDDAKRLEKAEKAASLKAAKRKRPTGNQRNS